MGYVGKELQYRINVVIIVEMLSLYVCISWIVNCQIELLRLIILYKLYVS